jgi:hypothetical protein
MKADLLMYVCLSMNEGKSHHEVYTEPATVKHDPTMHGMFDYYLKKGIHIIVHDVKE